MTRIPLRRLFQITFGSRMKVTLLFLVSVGIPSVFLLFLAIRGIKNDQALAEQRLLSEHKAIADSLVTEIDRNISLVEEDLVNLLGESAEAAESDSADPFARCASSALIDEVFWLRDGRLEYPYAGLLYHIEPDPRADHISPEQTDFRRLLGEAETNEFQLKNYARAEEIYRSALRRTRDDDTRADVLMRIARVSVRNGASSRSREALTAVVEQYSTSRLPGGLPGGVAGRLELAGLAMRDGDSAEAGQFLLELYRELLRSTWSLNRTQFRFVRNRIAALTMELEESAEWYETETHIRIQELSDRADSDASRTDDLLEVSSAALPMILDSIGVAIDAGRPSQRLVIGGGSQQFLLVIAGAAEHRHHHIRAAGAIVSQADLGHTLLPELVSHLSPGDNASLLVTRANGEIVYGVPPPAGSRLTATRACVGNFPPWSVSLYQDDPHFFAQWLSGRRSFYMYALVAVILALTFGAVMAARMMARDLELARLKSDFVSTVSHEFRSPLTSIRQLAEMLQSGRVLSEEHRQRYYDVIVEQSERLSLLIGNILDLARIDERRLSLDRGPVDMSALLNNIVVGVRQRGRGDDVPVTLQIDGPLPPAFVDPVAVTQVLNNLIDNAIKYSNAPAAVSIRVQRDGDHIVIAVADQGIGIPKSEIEKIFERFYRTGDASTRRVKGSGLGLALVRELVQAHGGTVQVASEVGKGSVFTVRLPLGENEESGHG